VCDLFRGPPAIRPPFSPPLTSHPCSLPLSDNSAGFFFPPPFCCLFELHSRLFAVREGVVKDGVFVELGSCYVRPLIPPLWPKFRLLFPQPGRFDLPVCEGKAFSLGPEFFTLRRLREKCEMVIFPRRVFSPSQKVHPAQTPAVRHLLQIGR